MSEPNEYGYHWPKKPLSDVLYGLTAPQLSHMVQEIANAVMDSGESVTLEATNPSPLAGTLHGMRWEARLMGQVPVEVIVCPDPSYGLLRLSGGKWKLDLQLYTYSPLAEHTEQVVVPTRSGLTTTNAYDPVFENPEAFRNDMVILRMFGFFQ